MFYLETANQLSLVVTLCFSFFLFVASLWFSKAEAFSRLLGQSFWIPFVLSVASFIAYRKAESDSLALMAELFILIFIFLLVLRKAGNYSYFLWSAMIYALPFALWILTVRLEDFQKFLQLPSVWIIAYLLPAIAGMYFLKNEHGTKGILFWSVLPLVVLPAVHFLLPTEYAQLLIPILKVAAYLIVLKYFHTAFFKTLTSTIAEAQSKINMVNRTLDLEVRKRIFEIEKVNQNLINKSKTDALTNAFNKSAILQEIENRITTSDIGEFSILMFDLDNFKKINDTLGHVEGDKCLKKLTAIARSNIRDIDVIGRYGGDEFLIILPGTSQNHTLQIAERFRKRVDASETPHFTISIGIATYPADGSTVKELIQAADEGLYHSKSKGRNAVSYKKNF